MDEHSPSRPVTAAQVMGIVASTMALFFMVAFVTKSVDAYRLKNWRDRLWGEIDEMIQQRVELEEELQRRESQSWLEEVLRDAGEVGEGMVSVVVAAATPDPRAQVPVSATPASGASASPTGSLLSTPHWKAWMRLLWGFD